MLNSNQNCIRCPSATNRRVMAVSLIKRKSLVDGGEHLVAALLACGRIWLFGAISSLRRS